MQWEGVSWIKSDCWRGEWGRRSGELTPLYIERFAGPRESPVLSRHTFWELICVLAGSGRLIGGDTKDLASGTLCLVPPGFKHTEQSAGKLDTIWIGLRGRFFDCVPAVIRVLRNQALAERAEQLWLFSVQQTGPIGPELDASTAGLLAHFFRLLAQSNTTAGAADALERAILFFHENFSRQQTIAETARSLGYSPGHFCRAFKQRTGRTPVDYLTGQRIQHARRLLEHTDWPIKQIAGQTGYEDQLYFSRMFRKIVRLTPTAYRRKTRS